MKKYIKEFIIRGMMYGGFGPIILGIIYVIIELNNVQLNLKSVDIFLGILSTYLIAFVQAGITVLSNIKMPLFKHAIIQGISIYSVYLIAYLVNGWMPFSWLVIIIFTFSFLITYIVLWLIIYAIINKTTKQLNNKLKGKMS